MKPLTSLLLAAAIAFPCMCAVAQDSTSYITVTPLNDHLYRFMAQGSGYTVNMFASVGDDGLLLVDAGQAHYSEELKTKVLALGYGPPKIIINTHVHIDHIGGNHIFGADPIIIAHEIVRTRMRSREYVFEEFPDESLPDIGFRDSLTINFNGEEIRLTAFPGSHDDNDIIVHFVESKKVAVGDISCGLAYPSVDYGSGRAVLFGEVIGKLVDYLPEDVLVLPGHGDPFDYPDLVRLHKGLVETTELILKAYAEGKDQQAMVDENLLADYDEWANGGYTVDAEGWIRSIVFRLEHPVQKKQIYAPLYWSVKADGLEAASDVYRDLHANHMEDYDVTPDDVWYLAYSFYGVKNYDAAIVFADFAIADFPEAETVYLAHYVRGVSHFKLGKEDIARQDAEACLKANPDNDYGTALMEKLDKN